MRELELQSILNFKDNFQASLPLENIVTVSQPSLLYYLSHLTGHLDRERSLGDLMPKRRSPSRLTLSETFVPVADFPCTFFPRKLLRKKRVLSPSHVFMMIFIW